MHSLFNPLFLAVALRTAIIGIVLVVGLRLAGKRELGQMNIYDLAAILLLANSVQNAMTEGKGQLGVGIASAGTLFCLGALVTTIFLRLPKLEERFTGVPTILIQDGEVLHEHLRREQVTMNELMQGLREHEIARVQEVRLAVFEPDGTISVVRRSTEDAP